MKKTIKDNAVYEPLVTHNDTNSWGPSISGGEKQVDRNTVFVTIELINSASSLPQQNPVRRALAEAAVRGYLLGSKSKLWEEASCSVPSFAIDLLHAVQAAAETTAKKCYGDRIIYQDLIGGEEALNQGSWVRSPRGGW